MNAGHVPNGKQVIVPGQKVVRTFGNVLNTGTLTLDIHIGVYDLLCVKP